MEENRISELETLSSWVKSARRILFFGGAGVSTESGIPDFRSVDGLYNQTYDYPPETILSHSFFAAKPAEFFRFYRDKMLFDPARIRPNAAHRALARLEAEGKMEGCGIVTQNIDGLHAEAGSRRVFELHGSMHRNYCTRCGASYPLSRMTDPCPETGGVPLCSCGGIIKPDVVLYEEPLNEATLEGAIRAMGAADLLIIGGTSMTVYPAAGLIRYFGGSRTVIINRGATGADHRADLIIRAPIGEVLGGLFPAGD